jgi:hypothetical protein
MRQAIVTDLQTQRPWADTGGPMEVDVTTVAEGYGRGRGWKGGRNSSRTGDQQQCGQQPKGRGHGRGRRSSGEQREQQQQPTYQ